MRKTTLSAMALLVAVSLTGCLGSSPAPEASSGSAEGPAPVASETATPTPTVEAVAGKGPECPELTCFSLMVTGDLLFHEGLWNQFAVDPAANDGENFDFVPLLQGQEKYIDQSDLAICHFETPVAEKGGPYSAYPIFNIPPEVITAVKTVGYDACTTGSNHSLDQGNEGIERTLGFLDEAGIPHTGSYLTEEDSLKPFLLEAEGGTLGLVEGVASLNGFIADEDWQVDRLRGVEEGAVAQKDLDRAITKAKESRKEGADVVAVAIHSLQEYIDYADDYQVSTAHALADSGEFDVIYGHGCHCAQPIEYYNDTWIVYGLGNTVTESADTAETLVNNQGLTVRFQFAGDAEGNWRVSDIAWVGSSNVQNGAYQWCSVGSDEPQGVCISPEADAGIRDRIGAVVNSLGAGDEGLHEWLVTED